MVYRYNCASDLYHHGVKGMKWGVRRASKIQRKANTARESADKWTEKAKRAQAKGKNRKAEKYSRYAAQDRADADKYQQKVDKSAEKRYAKAGKAAGKAAYYDYLGDKKYKDYDSRAKAMEKQAEYEDTHGKSLTALRLREAAKNIRAEGKSERQFYANIADRYLKKSNKLTTKANSFTSEARVNLGKKRVDSIIKNAKNKYYNRAKEQDEAIGVDSIVKNDQEYTRAKFLY